MKCTKCNKKAVLSRPMLCKEHFIKNFEAKVFAIIKKYGLFNKGSKACVAVSGGKDSTIALLFAQKICSNMTAIAIDEGIKGYRHETLNYLKDFCKKNNISLEIYEFKKEFGCALDEIIQKIPDIKPCMLCGILRRYLINKAAKNYDVVITGHNMDDESQSILMNLFYSNTELLAKLGPKSGIGSTAFTQRVKPLYLCSEKETTAYAFLKGFNVPFIECPYSELGFRAAVRDELNKLEAKKPSSKEKVIKNFLTILPQLKKHYISKYAAEKINKCITCGEPSKHETCNACKILASL